MVLHLAFADMPLNINSHGDKTKRSFYSRVFMENKIEINFDSYYFNPRYYYFSYFYFVFLFCADSWHLRANVEFELSIRGYCYLQDREYRIIRS